MQRLFDDLGRSYEGTHPWISFTLNLNELTARDWLLLGEADSKCAHLAGVPLMPEVAEELHRIYLTKGVHGTTAIEGNTLSEEEVRQIVDGELELSESQDYLEKEVVNIIDATNGILREVKEEGPQPITVDRLCRYNDLVLRDLALNEGVVPGQIRTDEVGVRRYLGAPAEDCHYLLERLCDWLNGDDFAADEKDAMGFVKTFARAIAAHLYLAWIHPYGDGNGRTARLLEFQIMIESGVPSPAAHLLSNHYNKTRTRYYSSLDDTSREPYSPVAFFEYALRGFVDELKSQIERVRTDQLEVTWQNFVHEFFQGKDTPTSRRQRQLALDLPPAWTQRSDIKHISIRVAEGYAAKGPKTVTRDLNALEEMGLIERENGGVRPRREVVAAFLPWRAEEGPVGL